MAEIEKFYYCWEIVCNCISNIGFSRKNVFSKKNLFFLHVVYYLFIYFFFELFVKDDRIYGYFDL